MEFIMPAQAFTSAKCKTTLLVLHNTLLIYAIQNISLENINGLNMRTYGWGTAKRRRNVYEASKSVNAKKEDCLGGLERKEEAKNNGMKWNCRLDIRKSIVTVQTVENSLPGEVVQTP